MTKLKSLQRTVKKIRDLYGNSILIFSVKGKGVPVLN
jgi:hypothetical protein